MVNNLFGSQAVRLPDAQGRKRPSLHLHASRQQQKAEHAPLFKQRMVHQPAEFPPAAEKHPNHRDAQQDVSRIGNSYAPRVMVHRQPTALPVFVERRLIETETLFGQDTVHGNGAAARGAVRPLPRP